MRRFNALDALATTLLVIGGLNWGLSAWFDFNLVTALFGPETLMTDIIYTLVGLSALYVALRGLFAAGTNENARVAYR